MLALLRTGKFGARYLTLRRHYIPSQPQKSQADAQLAIVNDNEEYWETPQYPTILDPAFASRKEREGLMWQNEIQKAPTVEEKLIKINMPKYYGYKVVQMSDSHLPYNCLPAIQHYTRTLYESAPADGETMDSNKLASLTEAVKGDVLEALELAHDYLSQKHPDVSNLDSVKRDRLLSQTLVEQINRALINSLSGDFSHLHEFEIDYNPRHEAFWAVGGIEAPKNVVKSKQGREWQKDMAKDSVDRLMQYQSQPMLALRHRLQLTPWKADIEYTNMEIAKNVPCFSHDPRTLGFTTGYQHGTNIPGYWPGNMAGFGCISYQSRPSMNICQQTNDPDAHLEARHAHAIQSSFAWLLAQANYKGFNTFSDLTYPMNTQTIITDGKYWSFYEYQLNTLLMNGRQNSENPRVNYCRGTEELKLYEDIDDNGKVTGFNDQVLHHLIKCYTNGPNVQRPTNELTPYLDTQYKRIADYPDEQKRTFLEKAFKHMSSNRPRHLELPETYIWEKIYKIDNKTRPLEARRRFFEVFVNPWKRSLDQHEKEYIPKVVRPEGPKSKKKFRPTYYP